MKKIYILFVSLLSHSLVFSQALPNPGFDNWTNQGSYDDPNNWNTLNSITSGFGAITVQKATGIDIHSGAAAIKLITQSVLGQNANGLATTGTIDVVGMTVNGGIPYTLRADSIIGWYKCDPQGADYGFVDFTLLDAAGTDTVGFAHFQSPNATVTTYTRFSVAINYHNTNTPALSRCVISSSAGVTAVLNSVLIIDDLDLIFNPNSVNDDLRLNNTAHFISSGQKLHVIMQSPGTIYVTDVTGKKVFETVAGKGSSEFSLESLSAGSYIYIITDQSSGKSSAGKFIAD
jgi:hypothetical protein